MNGMNTSLGTGWFTFYTKVRPCFVCLYSFIGILDFLQHPKSYLDYPVILLAFIASLVSGILCIMVAIKSIDDYYGDFVRFVKGVLVFEVCNCIYQLTAESYYISGLGTAVGTAIGSFFAAYFVWYKINIKYFRNRLLCTPEESAPSRYVLPESSPTQEEHQLESPYVVGKSAISDVVENESTPTGCIDTSSENNPPSQPGSTPSKKEPTSTPIQTASNKPKGKYCSRCGSMIDPTTKKCTGCGHQYFRGIPWMTVAVVILTLISLASCALNYYLIAERNELNTTIEELKDRNADLQSEVNELNLDISYLEYDINTLEDEKETYFNFWYDNHNKVDFIDEFVVFVRDDGTYQYHKYECYEFLSSEETFWAHNINYAEYQGYIPCPLCIE